LKIKQIDLSLQSANHAADVIIQAVAPVSGYIGVAIDLQSSFLNLGGDGLLCYAI